MKHPIKQLSALLIAVAAFTPMQSFAQDEPSSQEGWQFSVGVGAIYSPTYLGDDEFQVMYIPKWER